MQVVQAKHPSVRCERAAVELLTCPLGCPCVVQILMTVHFKPSTGHPAIASFFFLFLQAWPHTDRETDMTDRKAHNKSDTRLDRKQSTCANESRHLFFFLHAACKMCESHTMPCAMLIYSLKSTSVLLNRPTCSALAVATLLVHSPTEYGRHALRFSC